MQYSLMAGEQALATYAWEEALGHFQRGLATKEGQAMDADKAAFVFGLGRAQAATLERHRQYVGSKPCDTCVRILRRGRGCF